MGSPFASAPARWTISLAWTAVLLAGGRAPAQEVWINELMSANRSVLPDENGDFPDWFELYNGGTRTVPLDGWGVSDDRERPYKWVFQDRSLSPGEHLVVYASGKDRQPGPATPLAPAAVAGLKVWLRADSVDTNDPVQVRKSGGAILIRKWLDQSGHGNHAIQSNEANQPAWRIAGAGGKPSLKFDGANDQLALPRPPATNSFCLLVVFRSSQAHEIQSEGTAGTGGTTGQHYLFGARHGGDDRSGSGLSVGTNGVAVYEHGSGYMPALAVASTPLGTGSVVVAVNYSERAISLDVQGLEARGGIISPRFQVAAPFEIGSGAYGAFGGDLAEVLMYDRALSPDERRGIARYLASRHGAPTPRPPHTNFQLNADGEELQLTRPDGTTADYVRFGPILRDVSTGRQPDGGAAFLYFREPTPGEANTTAGATEILSVPRFSHPGGFHSNTFNLVLETDDPTVEIRYTLDGSEPKTNSFLYRQPLPIRGRAGAANTISMIPTVPGGPVPAGEVFKGWVVRAFACKSNALASEVVTRSYWVDSRGRGRYSLPVVSLATDRANFFDGKIGIYVPGNATNYSQRGPEWERPVHVELYETNGLLAFGQEAGVKIHGNTSQNFPIKGLDLDGTGGRGREPFRYALFPDRARREFEHFLIRPTGHDQLTAFMRDEMMQSLGGEIGAESQAARPCVLFINGEYWGLNYLKEKEDDEFVAHYADRSPGDIDYLEGYASPRAGDVLHYQEMIDFIAGHDLAVPAHYAGVGARMEIANYIDYKVCETFFYRWDIGNHRLWRPRAPEGRWRWLQFDNDVGWGGFGAQQPAWSFNMLGAVLSTDGSLNGHNGEATTFLLRRLLESPTFRSDFINRYQDLLNTLFLPAHTTERIDGMAAALGREMPEHIQRWRAPATVATWLNNVKYLRNYATNRPAYARAHLQQRFGLEPACKLSLSVTSTNGGFIRLNTLDIAAPPAAPWTGLYFKRHPVRLTANPLPGYRFAGWEGLYYPATNSVEILLNGDASIGARFEPDAAAVPSFASIQRLTAGQLRLRMTAQPALGYVVERSADLVVWSAVGPTLSCGADGIFEVTLTPPPGEARQFYRVRLP
jgi:hypothetical protein